MSGRAKVHAIAQGGRRTLCGRQLGSMVSSTEEASRVTCQRCKANEGWSRFFNDTIHRDGRNYRGPHPIVSHTPCKRWGRFWHGSTRKPHQFKLGDDGGCFEHSLWAAREFGGVIEHPADSHAWAHFNLNRPSRDGGWIAADFHGGYTCCVDQGHYGHVASKLTWLYVCGVDPAALPDLIWGKGEQRIHPRALELHGYEKARRIGMIAMMGGKDKVRLRNATPEPFRDVLLSIARTAKQERKAA